MTQEMDPDVEERFSKTQEHDLSEHPSDTSLEGLIAFVREKEQDMKDAVKRSIESILGTPVFVEAPRYIGEGQFEFRVSVTRDGVSETHTVITKEPEKKFD